MSNIFFSKGIGKYGIVRKASKIAEPATFFAVKTMQKNSKRLQSILNEISILHTLNHPNVVKLYEVFEDEKHIHLVMEYVDSGNLTQFFADNQNLSEQEIIKIIRQTLSAINYLHEMGICHKDIKPENLMVSRGTTK